MTQPEEPLRNVEYVHCPACFGARCKKCGGWGFVANPASSEERIALGLRALRPSSTLELTPQPKKRLRLPLRKRRKK